MNCFRQRNSRFSSKLGIFLPFLLLGCGRTTSVSLNIGRRPAQSIGETSTSAVNLPGVKGQKMSNVHSDLPLGANSSTNASPKLLSGTIPDIADCTGNALPPARFWRLTETQIVNSINFVFGGNPVSGVPALRKMRLADRFSNDSTLLFVAPDELQGLLEMTSAAASAILSKNTDFSSCAAAGATACVKSAGEKYGRLLWRRPLTQAESESFVTLFNAVLSAGATRADSLASVVEAMIQSPNFIYRSEIGQPVEGKSIRKLSNFEVATFLSYTLWNSTPDDELLKAAEAGNLADETKLKAQIQRMEASPRMKDGYQNLVDEWLGLAQINFLQRNEADDSAVLNSTLRSAMRKEVTTLTDEMIFKNKATIMDYFGSRKSFVNASLASHYNIAGNFSTTDFAGVDLPPNQRVGILSSGAFITGFSRTKGTGMVHRSNFVFQNLLCSPLPPPPPGVLSTVVENMNSSQAMTTRQKFETLHSSQATCGACHKNLDPVGGAFENYDGLARYRSTEFGLPVDSSGKLLGYRKSDFEFQTGAEFLTQYAQSNALKECSVLKSFQAIFGDLPQEQYSCEISRLNKTFKNESYRALTLLSGLNELQGILYRSEVKQ